VEAQYPAAVSETTNLFNVEKWLFQLDVKRDKNPQTNVGVSTKVGGVVGSRKKKKQ